MKRFILSLVVACASLSTLFAQDYSNGIGVVAGMINGVSYKHLNNHFLFQTDLGIGINYAPVGYGLVLNCWDTRLNPQIGYQGNLIEGKNGNFAGYFGGGVSLGEINDYEYNVLIGGVFGVNALLGLEYSFAQSPISFSFDVRPGYGLFFDSMDLISSFDWRLTIAVRRTF